MLIPLLYKPSLPGTAMARNGASTKLLSPTRDGSHSEGPSSPIVGTNLPKTQVPVMTLLFNFVMMSVAFAINHGTVTALISLASAYIGKHIGGVGVGILYGLYTASALVFAGGFTEYYGPKYVLSVGLTLYCVYVASFLVGSHVDSNELKWLAAMTGSVVGGVGAGVLWTAQGVYFSRTAQLMTDAYALESGPAWMKCNTLEEATAWLAGVFATLYVGFEVIMKGLSSLLQRWGSHDFVFTVFTIMACASAVAMWFVKNLPRDPTVPTPEEKYPDGYPWLRKIPLAIDLLKSSPKMILLGPLNASFGFASALLNFWVNGTLLKRAIGESNIGYMAAFSPMLATLLSLPYAWLTQRIGKGPMMVFGCMNYLGMALAVGCATEKQLEDLGWGISFIYLLGGSGRAVFEGTNKATFADFFPDDKEAAFANVIVLSGGAGAFGFAVFPYMSKEVMVIFTGLFSFISIFCIILAFRIHDREEANKSTGTKYSESLMSPNTNGGTDTGHTALDHDEESQI